MSTFPAERGGERVLFTFDLKTDLIIMLKNIKIQLQTQPQPQYQPQHQPQPQILKKTQEK